MPDWKRSMFVREAVLALDAASRAQTEAWAAGAGAAAQFAALLPQALSPGLADLLREDIGGIATRRSLVDVALLPDA